MSKPVKHRDLLVIRPWLSTYRGGDGYAHFDALVMRQYNEAVPQRYGYLDGLHCGDDERKTLLLEGFRFECQIDQRRAEAYGWRWGYSPARSGMFTAEDLDRYAGSISAMRRALRRIREEDGTSESVGRHVIRLARILRVDGVVVLETSSTGSFTAGMALRHCAAAPNFGPIMLSIDELQGELQEQCAAVLRHWAA